MNEELEKKVLKQMKKNKTSGFLALFAAFAAFFLVLINFKILKFPLTPKPHIEAEPETPIYLKWELAEMQWANFSSEYLQRIKKIYPKDKRSFTEIENNILKRYFPDSRFFSDGSTNFILTEKGEITGLTNIWPGGANYASTPNFKIKNDNALLSEKKILINSEETAIEIIRLIHYLHSSSNQEIENMEIDWNQNWNFNTYAVERGWVIEMHSKPLISDFKSLKWQITIDTHDYFQKVVKLDF